MMLIVILFLYSTNEFQEHVSDEFRDHTIAKQRARNEGPFQDA